MFYFLHTTPDHERLPELYIAANAAEAAPQPTNNSHDNVLNWLSHVIHPTSATLGWSTQYTPILPYIPPMQSRNQRIWWTAHGEHWSVINTLTPGVTSALTDSEDDESN